MMKFKALDQVTAIAVNSSKEVRIVRSIIKNYDMNRWVVQMPDGDLSECFVSAGPFTSFESAKKYAELNVGVV